MVELVQLAERYGAWLVIVIYIIYKFVPLFVEKGFPQWVAARRDEARLKVEAEAQDLAALTNVYERFIVQQEQTLKYIATSTEAVHSLTRSIDENTRQIYRMTQSVEVGPKCPLPACPFMHAEMRKPEDAG